MSGLRLNPNLLEVPLYIAGKSIDEVREELGLDEVTKLASNESPVGASPLALAAAQEMLQVAHRYPGIMDRELSRKVASLLHPSLDESNIVLGNGATDVLRMLTQAFVFDGGNTIMSRATFPMYHILTTAFGGTPRHVALTADYCHDLTAMAATIDDETRIVFLCSPNNPTGNVIGQAEADRFMASVPDHVVVLFDESYYDYVTESDYADSLAYILQGRNVISLRSFSKTAGLANMRVGYLISTQEVADYVRHAQLPFHTGDIALAAAAASLDDHEFHEKNLRAVVDGRCYFETMLREMNLNCLPSQANFVTIVDPPLEPKELAEALLRHGIIVRPMAAFGMPNALRVSVGSQAENAKFIEALKQVLSSFET